MKNIKTVVAVLLMVVLLVTLTVFLSFAIEGSTAKGSAQAETESMFGIVEGGGFDTYRIVVDRSNGVMYWMSAGSYNSGNLTLLVDADGMPRIWEGWEE